MSEFHNNRWKGNVSRKDLRQTFWCILCISCIICHSFCALFTYVMLFYFTYAQISLLTLNEFKRIMEIEVIHFPHTKIYTNSIIFLDGLLFTFLGYFQFRINFDCLFNTDLVSSLSCKS